MVHNPREQFGTRLGFILAATGSAVGLGNIWRFPYVVGANGGALFILVYVIILLTIGIPVLLTELSIGRASAKSVSTCFEALEPQGTKWHWAKYPMIFANYVVMAYYPIITGWLIYYFVGIVDGQLMDPSISSKQQFDGMVVDNSFYILLGAISVIFLCGWVCWFGIRKGLEKFSKPMMMLLFIVLISLSIYSICLPGGMEGVKKYLIPDFSSISFKDVVNTINAALAQAVFTLSIGVGLILVLASYMDKKKSLLSESLVIATLDTIVAICAGLVIFPACAAYDIPTSSGPSLLFDSMLSIFKKMDGGVYFGACFFLLMICAAITSIITIFENLHAILIDMFQITRRKAVLINSIIVIFIMAPTAYCFGDLSWINIAGYDLLTIEDFVFSNLLLPLGSLVFVLFCLTRYGWHTSHFLEEVNRGDGLKLPLSLRYYMRYVVPLVILLLFINSIAPKDFWDELIVLFD